MEPTGAIRTAERYYAALRQPYEQKEPKYEQELLYMNAYTL